jgi:hypothetical protein
VAPRAVDPAELERDVAAGRVVTLFRADGWSAPAGIWGRRSQPRYASNGSMVAGLGELFGGYVVPGW